MTRLMNVLDFFIAYVFYCEKIAVHWLHNSLRATPL